MGMISVLKPNRFKKVPYINIVKICQGFKKLDGVDPLITDPPPTSFIPLSKEKRKKKQLRVTHDT